jgi:4-hydroxy-tetrahydrodipicolinate synthase
VMITPMNDDKSIDWESLDKLIEWYLESDVKGLFAVCQSSEMFDLSNEERLELARHVVQRVNGRVPIIATGTFPDNEISNAEMVKRIYDSGVDAVIILTNLFARADEEEAVWIKNAEKLLAETGEIPLGMYECPYPYKRLTPPGTIAWAADTDRIFWTKDTSENILQIKEKLRVIKGKDISLYNAHTGSLLESLQAGVKGFAGIDSNFYPQLYSWICAHWEKDLKLAQQLQEFFIWGRKIIDHKYPMSAKEYLVMLGIIKSSATRQKKEPFIAAEIENLQKLHREVLSWQEKLETVTDTPLVRRME